MTDADRPHGPGNELTDREVALRFESLGGDRHGGEFGLFQRQCGADPLGLLRWADVEADRLAEALESRFDGIGDAGNTAAFIPDGCDEWWIEEKRYGVAIRSFVRTADATPDDMVVEASRQLRFLRRQLVEDLQAGEKIFVFRSRERTLTDAEVTRLHAAVRTYGKATLLYVRVAGTDHPAGSVEAPAPCLLVGSIDHLGGDTPKEAWLSLCQRARELQSARSARPRRSKPGRRRIVLVGNCQFDAMARLCERYIAGRTGDIVRVIPSYETLTPERCAVIQQADLVVEQVLDVGAQADAAGVASTTPRIFVPVVSGAFLWPFSGQAHPRNTAYPFFEIGPYPGEAGDSYLNRMIQAATDPEEAVAAYENLAINTRINLDRLYELVMDKQRLRDEATGYWIADVIEAHFRTEPVFLTPYHPNTRIAVTLAAQLFQQLGADSADIERMRNGTRVTPFPRDEMPLHPGVVRHWGLAYAPADRRYRFLSEGSFTFREYALRYMRYQWNDALEKGLFLSRGGDPNAALEALRAAVARSPRSAAGYNALGGALAHRGENDAAIAARHRAAELEPDNGSYRANLGELLRKLGRLEEAEAALQSAVAAEPMDSQNHALLGLLLKQRGDNDGAVRCLSEAVRLNPYAVNLRMELASQKAHASDVDGAIKELHDAIAVLPGSAALYGRLGQIQGSDGRTDDAIASMRTAIEIEPGKAEFHIRLSDFLLRREKKDEALTEARAALVCAPSSAPAHAHLAHALRLAGDVTAAERCLRRAAELAPDNAKIQRDLNVLTSGGEAAAAAQNRAREADRLAHSAHLMARADDLEGAKAALRQALDLVQERIDSRVLLSDLFARQGRLEEALAEVHVAVERAPNSPRAQGHLGHILQMMGKVEEADAIFRRAIDLDPGDSHLREQLAALQPRRAQVQAG
jgi:tetratricopeptide (TPR) repeat protein